MKETIAKLLKNLIKLDEKEILNLIEIPKDSSLGDYAFPCFILAKTFKKNPVEIAKEIVGKLKENKESKNFEKIEAVGPYINFFLNRNFLVEETLNKIQKEKSKYGEGKTKKEKIMIEFVSPNTNKPLHLGHLKNMSLGDSISRILSFNGTRVIKANLNNDRGIHICKSMLAYQKWGKNKNPKKEKIKSDHFVGDYYVMFSKAVKENPSLEEEIQEMLKKWEAGDKEIITLWKKMNSWAFEGFKETFKTFGIKFDKEYYESKLYKEGKELVLEGLKKGIFKKRDDGAIIADLTNEGLGEKVMIRADGTSIYITQDLYLAVLKDKEFKLDGSLYVVGNEQDYHFKVLFSILKKFGFKFANKLKHFSYGMVFLPEGKMKSREGTIVDADDIIEETQKLAKEEISKREKLSSKELEERSLKIALAAIKYMFLKIDYPRSITFNPKEAISFEGNTGPYLLYSYARAKSILNKAKYNPKKKYKLDNQNNKNSLNDLEKNLVFQLSNFPNIIAEAYNSLAPNIIANYAFQIAQTFNEFYHSNKVIGEKSEQFRLVLVDSFSQVLKNALSLLGIEVIEKM